MRHYNTNLKPHARRLRRKMTDAEALLWSRIRRKQILGVPFYRQKPIGRYIVDFFAPRAGLVVEVDGSQHYDNRGRVADDSRDRFLTRLKLKVIRFDNLAVLNETDAVVEAIYKAVSAGLKEGNPP